jgi:hypothetical protein
MHAGTSSSNKIAEMLAIVLLNNSSLQYDTLTAAILEFIRLSTFSESTIDTDGTINAGEV